MKILIVSQHFWPETFRINLLASELHAKGHDIEVLCGFPNYPEGKVFRGYSPWKPMRERHPSGFLVHRVPELSRGKGRAVRLLLNYLSYITSSILLGPILTRGRSYDVVFVYATSPIFQCSVAFIYRWMKRAKVAIWVQDLWPESMSSTGFVTSRILISIAGRISKSIYKNSDLILAQSRGFEEVLTRRVDGAVPVKFFPNPGERMAMFLPPATSYPLQEGFNVVFAGNMGTAQSLKTIVDAAQKISDTRIRIVMVGSGSRSAWMQQEVTRRGIGNIAFLGRVPSEDMPFIYSRASALLLTLSQSDNYSITIPSKVQSYLASGRPIVAALDGEGSDVIRDAGAGIVVPAEDSEELARALMKICEMPEHQRQAMGLAGKKYHKDNFSIEVLSDRLVAYFDDMIATRKV